VAEFRHISLLGWLSPPSCHEEFSFFIFSPGQPEPEIPRHDRSASARDATLAPEHAAVEIERVGEHRHLAESLAGRLTMRQFEAVEAARDLGYYEVPREAELADVASELDCTESTASALLRRAERALVDAALVR